MTWGKAGRRFCFPKVPRLFRKIMIYVSSTASPSCWWRSSSGWRLLGTSLATPWYLWGVDWSPSMSVQSSAGGWRAGGSWTLSLTSVRLQRSVLLRPHPPHFQYLFPICNILLRQQWSDHPSQRWIHFPCSGSPDAADAVVAETGGSQVSGIINFESGLLGSSGPPPNPFQAWKRVEPSHC